MANESQRPVKMVVPSSQEFSLNNLGECGINIRLLLREQPRENGTLGLGNQHFWFDKQKHSALPSLPKQIGRVATCPGISKRAPATAAIVPLAVV